MVRYLAPAGSRLTPLVRCAEITQRLMVLFDFGVAPEGRLAPQIEARKAAAMRCALAAWLQDAGLRLRP